ncbi:MAG: NUDIX domain-containing protein [Eubacterium sp.]|nr:NUDIX domain-containing protein [Eubacterium sp.]
MPTPITVPKNDLSYIGKTVTVTVDRPIGAAHPKHPGLIYPINYGYVEGLLAGDGEEQDVYVLGIDKPVDKTEVVIVAIAMRTDDDEDKWIGVPADLVGTDLCCECNIAKAIEFQEQYHTYELYAKYEKTCGAVIYCDISDNTQGRRYFLIKNRSGHIGFPKGHIEYGETERETALREVYEECGLKVTLAENFREEYTFTTLEDTIKTSVFFIGKFDKADAVKIQQEEVIGDWLLDYDAALAQLNWEQDKEIFRKAETFLHSEK